MVMSLIVGVFFVASLVGSVAYTRHVQQQADRRWCALFQTLDRPVPPTIRDPVQRQRSQTSQRQFHRLRVDLGCVKR